VNKLEFYTTLHVFGAVIWVGGGLIMQLFALRAQSADAGTRAWFFRNTEFLGQRVFLPSTIVILVTGLLMLGELPYDLGDGWVLFGFIVIILSAITGAGFLGPESGRIGKLVEAEGFDSPEVGRRYSRLLTISRIESLLLFLVIADMVAKPGT
jgi:uncharacterized membrane protein